ncbi:MAG: C25 family cysteine peptidase [Candidatus Cloacimonadales bacterium]|nr:C25 family cysteine peptidase [Candidatus Cloacimonadales bacterium]
MKLKYIVLTILTLIIQSLISINLSFEAEHIEISGSFQIAENSPETINAEQFCSISVLECFDSNVEGYEIPVYSKLVALPETGNFRVQDFYFEYEEQPLAFELKPFEIEKSAKAKRDEWLPKEPVKIGDPQIMRGSRFTQISCAAFQYNPARNMIRILKNIALKFDIDHSITKNPLLSNIPQKGFVNLAKNIIGNENISGTSGGNYLFIAPQNCSQTLQPLLRWKEKLGFKTKLAIFEEIGSNANDIRDFLQNAYDTWEEKPEFVVLVGDVTGAVQLPAFYVEGYLLPTCVTDHSYTLLDGDDYFPDVLIGRLSVQNISELQTIISKIINYERNPYLGTDWMKSALMVALIEEGNGYSQREVVMGIRDKLLDFEYTRVDTFISPWQTGPSLLESEINNGHSFICYRGAGHSTYWAGSGGPMFSNSNILNLNNGWMLPMVTSMTCGGGDFAAAETPTCFGELWLNAGSPTLPKGAIGFIGPSERDTQAPFNNANAMGIYQGITQESLYRCGEMLLRGKMELYNNFPNCHQWGGAEDSDQFYFYVYNLLGDPGLQVWTDIPQEVELEVSEVQAGSNFVSASVTTAESDNDNFMIAIISSDSLIATGITDAGGEVIIPVSLPIGTYEITASKYSYIPNTVSLDVQETDILGVQNYEFSAATTSGSTVDVDLEIYNYSHISADNVQIELLSQDENITVLSNIVSTASIGSNAVFNCSFQIQVSEEWNEGMISDLIVQMNSSLGENIALIPVQISSPDLALADFLVQNNSGNFLQNETSSVLLKLLNSGNDASGSFDAVISCLNDKAEILSGNTSFSNIALGDNGIALQEIQLKAENVISGETARFLLELSRNGESLQSLIFEIPIGIIDENSPTFCDYGYLAIESQDAGNFEAPVYDWFEIDPTLGGPGMQLTADHTLRDGFTKTISLPFLFRYFGIYYSTITICSEGYISMGNSDLIFFRNRMIPCGTGPETMIAPFWDSLVDEHVYAYHDVENHRFMVEWSDCGSDFNPELKNTFQVIFLDPEYQSSPGGAGEFLFQYKEIHDVDANENFATVGIENQAQNAGIQMVFAGYENPTAHVLENESAILFTMKEGPDIPYLTIEPANITVSATNDTIITRAITLLNNAEENADLNYTLSLTHFLRDAGRSENNPNRNIENDFIIQATGAYIPIEPINMLFYLVHNSPDGEPIQGVTLNFPDGFVVNSATDISALECNGETGNGAEITWGYGNVNVISPSTPISFHVNVTVDENTSGSVNVDWLIDGDGSGAEPHFADGSITILQSANDFIWIRYPNGGEHVMPGLQDSIRWDHYGNASNVRIEISRDSGTNWEYIIAETPNVGLYLYTFMGPLSDNCQLKISIPEENTYDFSDSLFQITALNITYPSETVTMSFGERDSIRWQDICGIEFVDIDISLDNGFSWTNLAEHTLNNGFFEFEVPGPPTEFALIRVSCPELDVVNYSERFTIVDSPVNWLILGVTEGSIPAGESENIELQFSTSGLEHGSYQANVRIETELGQILFVPVTLEYYQPISPVLNVQLYQNHPNPFNPLTKIEYDLPSECEVKLSIFNVRGQLVKTLVNETKPAGQHYEYWDGTDKFERPVSSGVYYYLLKAGNKSKAKKMILVK